MTKILWMLDGSEIYGEKRAIVSLAAGVKAAGWDVEAVSLRAGDCPAAVAAAGVAVRVMDVRESPSMHRARGKISRAWQAVKLLRHQFYLGRRIRAEVRRSGADAVHVLNKNMLPAVAWAAKREGKACFWEMTAVVGRGYPLQLNWRLHRWLIRWLGIIPLANSRYTAETLARGGPMPAVMYLGADEERFDPARVRAAGREGLGIPEGAAVFAIVARVEESKGQRVFLEAMLRETGGDVHLVLVGALPGSEEAGRIMEMARAKGAESRVHLVERTDVPEAYMAMADVVVNSRLDAEPFGLSTVEAMMMGKPLLVHALGGPAETVVDGETGWHVGEATVEGFAGGIRRAMGDRWRWGDLGAAGRERALKVFTLREQVRRYQELVSDELARGVRA